MTLSNCSGTVTQYIKPIFLQDDREHTLRLNIAGWGQQSLGDFFIFMEKTIAEFYI